MRSAAIRITLPLLLLAGCDVVSGPVETSVATSVVVEEPPQGWVDHSDDERWEARLLSSEGNAGLSAGCETDGHHPTEAQVHYDPFPSENLGYSYSQRWAFFTDGEAGLYGDRSLVVTTEVYEALAGSELLVYEMDAYKAPYEGALREYSNKGERWVGEDEWEHPPPVYFHRVMFDLGTDRSVLVAVLDRCGVASADDLDL